MWSDNDIDNAFQRLNPPEPEPAPFPLDAWLRLETQLDKEEVARTVRRKMWRFFAAEMLIVALAGLGWLLWKPAGPAATAVSAVAAAEATRTQSQRLSTAAVAATRATAAPQLHNAAAASPLAPAPAVAMATAVASATPAAAKAAPATATTSSAPLDGRHSVTAPNRPALAVVAATPQRRKPLARRTAETPASRFVIAQALVPAGSRKAGRLVADRAQLGSQSAFSSGAARLTPQTSAAVATPDARATASATTDRTRRRGQAAEHDAGLLSVATEEAPAASVAIADRSAESGLVPNDNTELAPKPASMPTATLALLTPLALVAETKPVTNAPEPRFFIGLVGAPDVSTVKFVSVEKPLLNLGLTVEYRFTNRLRVSTGLLRANKEYYARRDDYDWKNYPRAQTRDITWVEGKCTVLDVPLNLRYDAVVWDNARWFGSVGLSSFFMHRENYSYDYLEGGDYKLWEMPGLVNANQHLFSVLNLSAGYERSLGQHWRLQAEPYFKLPLAGVGAGSVKLTSAGVFLGMKYGF